jgi:hypothetical protein
MVKNRWQILEGAIHLMCSNFAGKLADFVITRNGVVETISLPSPPPSFKYEKGRLGHISNSCHCQLFNFSPSFSGWWMRTGRHCGQIQRVFPLN